ncbi:hypothetical protein COT47_01920, partial [Candidatus Woesearchaeota archaeon CG08_land_8_20_14_0_20_43_7]
GDNYPIAFYPNSVEECYRYTIEAFNAAEDAECPVFLLCDGFIAHLYEAIDMVRIRTKSRKRARKPLGSTEARHFTGLLSKDQMPATKDTKRYREWHRKVKAKVSKAARSYQFYEYQENEKSNTLIISYGIVSRMTNELKDKYSLFRPIRIFPLLDKQLINACSKHKNIICVEMNDGQYAREVQALIKRDVVSLPILGGNITHAELVKGIDKILRSKKHGR